MPFALIDFYCLSIGIAAIIAVVRLSKIHSSYYPFLVLCWTAFITEIIAYFMVYNHGNTYVTYGIYAFIESLLLLWLFRTWNVFDKRPWLFWVLVLLFTTGWLIDILWLSRFKYNMTWFRLEYAFVIVLLSIHKLSTQLSVQRGPLWRQPEFIICICLIVFYTFVVLAGVFEIYGYGGSNVFRDKMQKILVYTNFIVNLIYIVAVLCMGRRRHFSLPY